MADRESELKEPVVSAETDTPQLSDADTQLLTEARTASWRIEQYEFAYDTTVRTLSFRQTVLDFLGVLVAVIFLFLQFAVPDQNTTVQATLGVAGTGLSSAVILAAIWTSMAQWKSRIEKMQRLSSEARDLLKSYERIVTARPVDHPRIRKWLIDCLTFDEHRKEPLATVSTLCMKRAFQHIGNRHMGRGVVCGICNYEWKHESNKKARWSWVPFYGCSGCGVN